MDTNIVTHLDNRIAEVRHCIKALTCTQDESPLINESDGETLFQLTKELAQLEQYKRG